MPSDNQQTAILNKTEPLDPLTVREQEVLQWILAGKSNREIAAALYISESTVKAMQETFSPNMMLPAALS